MNQCGTLHQKAKKEREREVNETKQNLSMFFWKKITWNFELFVENWLHSAQCALRAATKQAKETVLLRRKKSIRTHRSELIQGRIHFRKAIYKYLLRVLVTWMYRLQHKNLKKILYKHTHEMYATEWRGSRLRMIVSLHCNWWRETSVTYQDENHHHKNNTQ